MLGAAFERERSFSIGMASPYVSVLCEFACKSVAKNTLRTRRPSALSVWFYPRLSAQICGEDVLRSPSPLSFRFVGRGGQTYERSLRRGVWMDACKSVAKNTLRTRRPLR